ncbi:MAG TPA: response regulator [Bryobacteraceae bacterium]|jgi:CheY-like chemotaxis protein
MVLVEDNPADELVIRDCVAQRFPDAVLSVQKDGERMMRWIDMIETEYAPLPNVILLDLNLPRFTGEQVLERLHSLPKFQGIPVVIVTSSDAPSDRTATARLGAAVYFRKPADYDDFLKLGEVIHSVLYPSVSASAQI